MLFPHLVRVSQISRFVRRFCSGLLLPPFIGCRLSISYCLHYLSQFGDELWVLEFGILLYFLPAVVPWVFCMSEYVSAYISRRDFQRKYSNYWIKKAASVLSPETFERRYQTNIKQKTETYVQMSDYIVNQNVTICIKWSWWGSLEATILWFYNLTSVSLERYSILNWVELFFPT